jgi:anti-anti-sigma regulatory factor
MNPTSLSANRLVSAEVVSGRQVLTLRVVLLDWTVAETLSEEVSPHLESNLPVVVDLSAVRYADHFGFEFLLSIVRSCKGEVRFRHARVGLESLFVLAHLSRLLEQ